MDWSKTGRHSVLLWRLTLRNFYYSLYVRCILWWRRAVGPFGGLSTSTSTQPCAAWCSSCKRYEYSSCVSSSVAYWCSSFLYRDRSLLPWALGRSVHPVLPRGTLFQLGYGTHHWHSNSSSVCSRRHCLCDCHRTRLSDSSLLFVRFEVSVYYYYMKL